MATQHSVRSAFHFKMLPQSGRDTLSALLCINTFIITATLLLCLSDVVPAASSTSEGQACTVQLGVSGTCSLPRNCPQLERLMTQLGLSAKDVVRCGFNFYEEIICCPSNMPMVYDGVFNIMQPFLNHTRNSEDGKSLTPTGFTSHISSPMGRKAVEACRQIESLTEPRTGPLIIGGVSVAPGEYPHMAAIGYGTLGGNSGPPYNFRCGGALIDKRFVLTAAHCVNRRDLSPVIVRLGVTDFNDAQQVRNGIDANIELVHIHPNYNSLEKHDDIALIELKVDVTFTPLVLPACLYTDLADPPADTKLNVTGWGTTNLKTKQKSDILQQARVQIVPLARCNETFVREGVLPKGILHTHLCTQDPNMNSDACFGDSGGPLNLITDDTHPMRIVGVISAGIGCASSTPGLYTRVASYLDFIERIVWP